MAESWPDRGCGRTVLPVVSRQVPWRKVLAWSGLLVAAVVVAAAAVYVIFWPVSDLIARHDVGAITGRGYGAALQAARDAARGRLVAFGAGLFAAGALIYTARNFSLARQGPGDRPLHQGNRAARLGQARRAHRRHLRAGAHRPGFAPDHPTIMEVLAAFIRDHSREQWPPPSPAPRTPERSTRPDVQAAVTVVGRRDARSATSRLLTSPARTSPARTSPARTSPARTSPARTSPARTSPARTSPARTSRREPHRREPHRREPHRREPHRREPHRRAPLRRGPHRREPHPRAPRRRQVAGRSTSPAGWMVDSGSARLKRVDELSEVMTHYL